MDRSGRVWDLLRVPFAPWSEEQGCPWAWALGTVVSPLVSGNPSSPASLLMLPESFPVSFLFKQSQTDTWGTIVFKLVKKSTGKMLGQEKGKRSGTDRTKKISGGVAGRAWLLRQERPQGCWSERPQRAPSGGWRQWGCGGGTCGVLPKCVETGWRGSRGHVVSGETLVSVNSSFLLTWFVWCSPRKHCYCCLVHGLTTKKTVRNRETQTAHFTRQNGI